MSKLSAWRKEQNLRLVDLQDRLAKRKILVSLATLSRLENEGGLSPDRAALLRALEKMTKGEVTVADMIP